MRPAPSIGPITAFRMAVLLLVLMAIAIVPSVSQSNGDGHLVAELVFRYRNTGGDPESWFWNEASAEGRAVLHVYSYSDYLVDQLEAAYESLARSHAWLMELRQRSDRIEEIAQENEALLGLMRRYFELLEILLERGSSYLQDRGIAGSSGSTSIAENTLAAAGNLISEIENGHFLDQAVKRRAAVAGGLTGLEFARATTSLLSDMAEATRRIDRAFRSIDVIERALDAGTGIVIGKGTMSIELIAQAGGCRTETPVRATGSVTVEGRIRRDGLLRYLDLTLWETWYETHSGNMICPDPLDPEEYVTKPFELSPAFSMKSVSIPFVNGGTAELHDDTSPVGLGIDQESWFKLHM